LGKWKKKLPDQLKYEIINKLGKCSRPPTTEDGELPPGWSAIEKRTWAMIAAKIPAKMVYHCGNGETKEALRKKAKEKYYGYGIHTPRDVGYAILNFLGKTNEPDIIDLINSSEEITHKTEITTLAKEILKLHNKKFLGMFENNALVTTYRPTDKDPTKSAFGHTAKVISRHKTDPDKYILKCVTRCKTCRCRRDLYFEKNADETFERGFDNILPGDWTFQYMDGSGNITEQKDGKKLYYLKDQYNNWEQLRPPRHWNGRVHPGHPKSATWIMP